MKIYGRAFLGNGDASLAVVGYLHSQLARAFVLLGGSQQSPHEGSLEDRQREIDETAEQAERIADEIYLALTGKHVPTYRKKKSKRRKK